jgi:ATP/ADP translocase
MKKKKEKQQEKVENKLVDIMNNDSMKLFSMLSLYFLLVLLIYTIFQFLNLNSLLIRYS